MGAPKLSRILSRRTLRWTGHPAGTGVGILTVESAWVPSNFKLSVKDMRGAVAFACAAGLAFGPAGACESGWRRGPRNSLALGLHGGGHCGVGLQRHSAPARWSVPVALARKPQHFSGGPTRAFKRAAGPLAVAPAAFQHRRTLTSSVAASCGPAVNLGLALVWAASDNRSMHTDTLVRRVAARRLFLGAGDFQR